MENKIKQKIIFFMVLGLIALVIFVLNGTQIYRSNSRMPNTPRLPNATPTIFLDQKTDCKEFADKNSNYMVGEILVSFISGTTDTQAEGIILELGASIKEPLLLERTFLIQVPPGQEEDFVRLFSKNSLVEFAEKNHCNNAGPN